MCTIYTTIRQLILASLLAAGFLGVNGGAQTVVDL